jgi:hypothetical protein
MAAISKPSLMAMHRDRKSRNFQHLLLTSSLDPGSRGVAGRGSAGERPGYGGGMDGERVRGRPAAHRGAVEGIILRGECKCPSAATLATLHRPHGSSSEP